METKIAMNGLFSIVLTLSELYGSEAPTVERGVSSAATWSNGCQYTSTCCNATLKLTRLVGHELNEVIIEAAKGEISPNSDARTNL